MKDVNIQEVITKIINDYKQEKGMEKQYRKNRDKKIKEFLKEVVK